jgi:hypothetical protein
MYLYYTIQVSQNKKSVKFVAHDFPVIQYLRELYERVEKQPPSYSINNYSYSENYLLSPFGLEHSISLRKIIKNDEEYYSIHIYEELGNSAEFTRITKEELLALIEYVENEIQECINEFKNRHIGGLNGILAK